MSYIRKLPWACCILMAGHLRFFVKRLATLFTNMTFSSEMYSIEMLFQIKLFIKSQTADFTLERSTIVNLFWMFLPLRDGFTLKFTIQSWTICLKCINCFRCCNFCLFIWPEIEKKNIRGKSLLESWVSTFLSESHP